MFNDALLWERVGVGEIVDFARHAGDQGYLDPDDVPVRELFLARAVLEEMNGWADEAYEKMIAEMVQFVTGGLVTWGSPRRGNHIKPLNTQLRFSEFKVRERPQTRLFGAFVRQDVFVGHHASLRSETPTQDHLADRWREVWGEDIARLELDDPEQLLTNYRLRI
jgi:hypothetical protein